MEKKQADPHFMEALRIYNVALAESNHGVIDSVSFQDNQSTKSNILVTIIGIIVGIFTGFGFFRTSEGATGTAILVEDGLHFFQTKGKKEKMEIDIHVFFPYSEINKAVRGRSIIFTKELRLHGTYINKNGKTVGYRLDINMFKEDLAQVQVITDKLAQGNIPLQAGRKLLGAIILLAVVGGIALVVNFKDSIIPSRPVVVVVVEGDVYTSEGGNYSITFVSARQSVEGVGQHQRDVIVIYYDYHALRAHSAGRPLGRFDIYQGDTLLDQWDGGLRMVSGVDRGFLTSQRLESGETFYARGAFVMANTSESIRIVKYNNNGAVIFTHSLYID